MNVRCSALRREYFRRHLHPRPGGRRLPRAAPSVLRPPAFFEAFRSGLAPRSNVAVGRRPPPRGRHSSAEAPRGAIRALTIRFFPTSSIRRGPEPSPRTNKRQQPVSDRSPLSKQTSGGLSDSLGLSDLAHLPALPPLWESLDAGPRTGRSGSPPPRPRQAKLGQDKTPLFRLVLRRTDPGGVAEDHGLRPPGARTSHRSPSLDRRMAGKTEGTKKEASLASTFRPPDGDAYGRTRPSPIDSLFTSPASSGLRTTAQSYRLWPGIGSATLAGPN